MGSGLVWLCLFWSQIGYHARAVTLHNETHETSSSLSSPSPSSSSSFHQLRQEYFTQLSSKLQKMTRSMHQLYPDPSQHAVGFSTCIKFYGGYGNFIGSLVTAAVISFYSNRILVLNNPVLVSMFQHPDPMQSFNSFNVTSLYCPKSCPDIVRASTSLEKVIGVNRCDGQVIHDQNVATWYVKNIAIPLVPLSTGSLLELYRPHYELIHWLLSNPTPGWGSHMQKRAKMVYANCSQHGVVPHRANLALQIRTFSDMGRTSTASQEQCYIDCTLEIAKSLHDAHLHHICLMVTSDNSELTDRVIEKLEMTSYITAVHNDYPNASILSHSGNILMDHRLDKSFSLDKIMDHPEFVDWMLLSDAEVAVYTHGSTFAMSARHRAGVIRAKDDRAVSFQPGDCKCHAVSSQRRFRR